MHISYVVKHGETYPEGFSKILHKITKQLLLAVGPDKYFINLNIAILYS